MLLQILGKFKSGEELAQKLGPDSAPAEHRWSEETYARYRRIISSLEPAFRGNSDENSKDSLSLYKSLRAEIGKVLAIRMLDFSDDPKSQHVVTLAKNELDQFSDAVRLGKNPLHVVTSGMFILTDIRMLQSEEAHRLQTEAEETKGRLQNELDTAGARMRELEKEVHKLQTEVQENAKDTSDASAQCEPDAGLDGVKQDESLFTILATMAPTFTSTSTSLSSSSSYLSSPSAEAAEVEGLNRITPFNQYKRLLRLLARDLGICLTGEGYTYDVTQCDSDNNYLSDFLSITEGGIPSIPHAQQATIKEAFDQLESLCDGASRKSILMALSSNQLEQRVPIIMRDVKTQGTLLLLEENQRQKIEKENRASALIARRYHEHTEFKLYNQRIQALQKELAQARKYLRDGNIGTVDQCLQKFRPS
jgi:hypothetical protein